MVEAEAEAETDSAARDASGTAVAAVAAAPADAHPAASQPQTQAKRPNPNGRIHRDPYIICRASIDFTGPSACKAASPRPRAAPAPGSFQVKLRARKSAQAKPRFLRCNA